MVVLVCSCCVCEAVVFVCNCHVCLPLLLQWRREQEFDLQLLERAVQGEEARGVVQGEECPAEHSDRPRSQSDEWLTLRSTATSTLTQEVDLETLDYDLDLSREVQPDPHHLHHQTSPSQSWSL